MLGLLLNLKQNFIGLISVICFSALWASFFNPSHATPLKPNSEAFSSYQDRYIAFHRGMDWQNLQVLLRELFKSIEQNAILHPNYPGTSLFFVSNWLVVEIEKEWKNEQNPGLLRVDLGGYFNPLDADGSDLDRFAVKGNSVRILERYLNETFSSKLDTFKLEIRLHHFLRSQEEYRLLTEKAGRFNSKRFIFFVKETQKNQYHLARNSLLNQMPNIVWFSDRLITSSSQLQSEKVDPFDFITLRRNKGLFKGYQ